jgi:hypothetical protein
MIRLIARLVIKNIPWVLLLVIFSWLYFSDNLPFQSEKKIIQSELEQGVLLEKVINLGRLELVKYQFQEITELRNISKFKLFFQQYSPDMKVALITQGEAVGCIDLAKLTKEDVNYSNDTLRIILPQPEICYYKIDLENSRIYSLETSFLASDEEERKMIQEVYQQAERKIKASAIEGGIIDQTRKNARQFLDPLFRNTFGVPVIINYVPENPTIQSH